MMIPAEVGSVEFSLAIVGSSEFSSPNNESILKQSSLLEIPDQGIGCPVGLLALFFYSAG